VLAVDPDRAGQRPGRFHDQGGISLGLDPAGGKGREDVELAGVDVVEAVGGEGQGEIGRFGGKARPDAHLAAAAGIDEDGDVRLLDA
jgi:hypothetical protein